MAQAQVFVSQKYFVSRFASFHSYLKDSCCRNSFQLVQQDHFLIFMQNVFALFYVSFFWLKWNFFLCEILLTQLMIGKALLLKEEYFKNIFTVKSEKNDLIYFTTRVSGMSDTIATRMKNLDFHNSTSGNIFSYPILALWQMKDYTRRETISF